MTEIIVPSLKLRFKNNGDLSDYVDDKIIKVPLVFPDTTPKIADVVTMAANFHDAVVKAIHGTPSDTAKKNSLRRKLSIMITDLAYDCAYQAQGDTVKYLATGFEMKRKATPGPALTAPQNLRLLIINDGELDARFDAVPGAKAYLIYMGEDPANVTAFTLAGTSSDTNFTLINLTSGTRYYVRVRAIGTRKSEGPWSSVISKICS